MFSSFKARLTVEIILRMRETKKKTVDRIRRLKRDGRISED